MKKFRIIDIATGQTLLGVYAKTHQGAMLTFNRIAYNHYARAIQVD